MTEHRCAWLVDVGYVVGAGVFKLDYLAARRAIEAQFGPTRIFLFNGFDAAYGIADGLQRFYDLMRREGAEIRLHRMQSARGGKPHQQRRVDVDLAVHVVWQAGLATVGTVVVTTGDQDLVPAFELARREFGVRCVLLSYDVDVHGDLIEAADEWRLLEDRRDVLELRSR